VNRPDFFTNSLTAGWILILLGIALFLLVRTMRDVKAFRSKTRLRANVIAAAWVLVIFGVLCMSLLYCIIFLIVVGMAFVQYRAYQRDMLFWSLSIAADRGIPLATAAQVSASQRWGGARSKAAAFAERLEAGVPLSAALTETGHVNSDEIKALLTVGEQTGGMVPALREAASARAATQPLWQLVAARMFYLFAVLIFAQAALTFHLWKIVPAFEKIFADFGVTLPAPTQVLIDISEWLMTYGALLVLLPVVLGLLLLFVILRYIGLVRFEPFGLRWAFRVQHAAIILRCLAIVADRGKPFGATLEMLGESYPSGRQRNQLRQAALAVGRGEPWQDALCRSGLLRQADAALLLAAQRVGNLPWALRTAADQVSRRSLYRGQMAAQVAGFFLILAVALVIMFVVVALFIPIVKLINSLV
jgi:type II secretory pathway component PulF